MDPALPARVTIGRQLHRGRTIMQIARIGLDLAKYVFEIHGVDAQSKTVVRKTLRRHARLISPQFVTPYVKSNKNDRNDAEAICEAVGRPNMRFVPSSPPNSWRCKRFIGFAVAWLLIASGSSIRSEVFSGSTALSLQRTQAICGELWRGSSATMRTALSMTLF